MNKIDKDKLFQSISADFKIIVRKTELWKMEYCEQILHDIELLLSYDFLSKIHLIMKDNNSLAIRCNRYEINYGLSANTDDRAGNNDWDNIDGTSLTVVLSYTDTWRSFEEPNKSDFKKSLKISWANSQEDLLFLHLRENKSKKFNASNAYIQRTDFK
jgi:hypothetical protein